jgi:hypothetical protein
MLRIINTIKKKSVRKNWKGSGQEICKYVVLYHSIGLKFLHLVEPFVYFLNFVFCRIFRFSHLSVVSLPCPSPGLKGKIFSLGLHKKLMRAPETPSTGTAKSPGLGQCPSSKFVRRNNICMRAVLDSQYEATTVAAECPIAQLHSQDKLTTPSRENWKIRHEIEILKANEHASYV